MADMNKRIVFGRWRGTGSFQCGNLTKCTTDWAHCGDKCREYAIVDAKELELLEKQLEAAEARVKDLEEEMEANKWQSKERGERIQELEIQCAVMREALEYADLCIRRERDEIESIPQIAKALSSDAGRNLLERLRKLKARLRELNTWRNAVLKARECVNQAYHDVDEYTMPQGLPDARLLENAIKELRKAAQLIDSNYCGMAFEGLEEDE